MTHQCPTCGHEVDEVPVEALCWIIPKNTSGAGNWGRYRLEKIEPVSAPYKFANEG